MNLTSTFTDVKGKIEAETGMPPGKQKLQCEGVFVKGKIDFLVLQRKMSEIFLIFLISAASFDVNV